MSANTGCVLMLAILCAFIVGMFALIIYAP